MAGAAAMMPRLSTLLRHTDARAAMGLALLSVIIGAAYFLGNSQPVWPTPATAVEVGYEASINVALGEGFRGRDLRNAPEVEAFLNLQRTSLQPSDIAPAETYQPSPIQQQHIYLFTFVGWLWGLFGISWTVVKMVLVAALALCTILSYAIFRQCIRPGISVVLSILFVTAPFTICMLPTPRDFLRAPFLLGVVLLLVLMIRQRHTLEQASLYAIGLGALIGIGFGFRHDLLVCVPIAVLTLAILMPSEGAAVRHRALDILLFFGAFIMAASPVLASHGESGTTTYLHILNGLPSACEDDLGVGRASYERMYLSNANLIDAMAWSYARRSEGSLEPLQTDSIRFQNVCRDMLLSHVTTFPGDALAFVLASFLRVSEGAGGVVSPPQALTENPIMPWARAAWFPIHTLLLALGPFVTLLAIAILLARNLRIGLSLVVVMAYFSCYPALEFQWRHVFHMLVLPLWAGGFVVDAGLREWASARAKNQGLMDWCRGRFAWCRDSRMAIAAVVSGAILLAGLPFGAAALVQDWRLQSMYQQLRETEIAPLAYEESTLDVTAGSAFSFSGPEYCASNARRFNFVSYQQLGKWTLLDVAGLPEPRVTSRTNIVTPELDEYLCVELAPCPRWRALWIRYAADGDPGSDFSRIVFIAPDNAPESESTRYFFPVYQCPGVKFLGVGLRPHDAPALRGIHRVTTADSLAIWPNITVPADRGSFIGRQAVFPLWPHNLALNMPQAAP